jgi:hypothetical protein
LSNQLLAHGQWFSLGIPASSTTKAGHHDIAEILLKVALKHQKSKINQYTSCNFHLFITKICLASSNERMMNAIVFSSHRFALWLLFFFTEGQ